MNIYQEYQAQKRKVEEETKKLNSIKGRLWAKHESGIKNKGIGSYSVKEDGFKFTHTLTEKVVVDQEFAKAHPELFVVKYEHKAKHYDTLSEDQKALWKTGITTRPAKTPTIKVEEIE